MAIESAQQSASAKRNKQRSNNTAKDGHQPQETEMKAILAKAHALVDRAIDQRTRPSEEEADAILELLYTLEETHESNTLIEQIEAMME